MPFPLEQWFDLTERISKFDADLAEAQMMLYAIKDGMDPDNPDARRQYLEMRRAVKEHNKKFPPPTPYRGKASKRRQTNREKEKQKKCQQA